MGAEFRGGQNVAVILRDILVPTAVGSLAGYILNALTKFSGVFEYSLWTEKPYVLGWRSSVANKSNSKFMRWQSVWLRVMVFLVSIAQGNTCEPCVPKVIFDRAFVSMFVSIWIFEGDPEVYILAQACESS